MECRLLGAKTWHDPTIACRSFQWIFNRNAHISIQQNALENCVPGVNIMKVINRGDVVYNTTGHNCLFVRHHVRGFLQTKVQLYRKYIPFWGLIEQLNEIKIISKIPLSPIGVPSTRNNILTSSCLVSITIIRQYRILSYWLKIISGKKSRYVNVLYHAALSRVKENDSYNWVSDVKKLLCSIGFGDVWYNQGVIDQTWFLCVIKQRLFDISKHSWSARLVESPRARFYRQVVDQHMFHRLLDVIPCKHRIALTRLIAAIALELKLVDGRDQLFNVNRGYAMCVTK